MQQATVTITRTPDGGCYVHGRRIADAVDQACAWARAHYPGHRVFLVESARGADPCEPPLVQRADAAYTLLVCMACAALLLLAVWVVS